MTILLGDPLVKEVEAEAEAETDIARTGEIVTTTEIADEETMTETEDPVVTMTETAITGEDEMTTGIAIATTAIGTETVEMNETRGKRPPNLS